MMESSNLVREMAIEAYRERKKGAGKKADLNLVVYQFIVGIDI